MKRVLLLLATVAACNQVYGLDSTILVDAPPAVPPPECGANLVFRLQWQQAVLQDCNFYSIAVDAGRALAYCHRPSPFIGEGPVDAPLEAVTVEGFTNNVLPFPRFAPEGDRMVLAFGSPQGTTSFRMYGRDGSGWSNRYTLPVSVELDDSVGTPSRRPSARLMHARPNAGIVDEWVEDAPDTWRFLHAYRAQDLGTISLYTQFNLTADGLHAVFQQARVDGSYAIAHAWRDTIDVPFGQAVPIMGVPRSAIDAFMTPDCGRMYFAGLGSIFYAQQQ